MSAIFLLDSLIADILVTARFTTSPPFCALVRVSSASSFTSFALSAF
jgi:hypothetical protein